MLFDGRTVQVQDGFDYIKPWSAQTIIFNAWTFEPITRTAQTQGGERIIYDRISDNLGTYDIFRYTPRLPRGLRNPELSESGQRVDRTRNTITPTHDGLVFELVRGDPFVSRRVIFWRRGEPWWSYARVDTLDVDAGTDLETSFETNENSAVAWAVKLSPGQPDSFDCNSRH